MRSQTSKPYIDRKKNSPDGIEDTLFGDYYAFGKKIFDFKKVV